MTTTKKKQVKKVVAKKKAPPAKPAPVSYAERYPHVEAITAFVGEGRARRPRW